jgi:hypothetical protein
MKQDKNAEGLEKEVSHMLEEARMVLPGIQAFAGFQLIAVFNERFTALMEWEQVLHFAALLLVVLSAALVMTPAAYHRIAEEGEISRRFARMTSVLLATALAPLAVGISCDVYLIGRMILPGPGISLAVAAGSFLLLVGLWFVFPLAAKRRG